MGCLVPCDERWHYSGAVIIDASGNLVLQKRDVKQGLMDSGKISTFGGRAFDGESKIDALIRELHEELGYIFSGHFIYIGRYFHSAKGYLTECSYFLVYAPSYELCNANEGTIIKFSSIDSALARNDLAAGCTYALNLTKSVIKKKSPPKL